MRRVAVIALCVGLAGCGLGPGAPEGGSGAYLRVTRDFGQKVLATASVKQVRPSDTVMRLLEAHTRTTTRYGGGFVQSIDGIAGTGKGGRHDWFYFVNGLEAPTGAAARTLSPGDVVQWDYRNWDATERVPAIVGAFPEPFIRGQEGKRYPTRIECATSTKSCSEVQAQFSRAGISAGTGTLGSEARGNVLRVEVGKWADIRALSDIQSLEHGPAVSGVYARFVNRGTQLQLLDEHGNVARTAPPGTGLVAAVLPENQQPVWVVTGVDEAGVKRAATLLTTATLRNAYAVAALPAGAQRLPLGAGG